MTEGVHQLHHDSAPANCTALLQVFLVGGGVRAKHHITQVCQAPLQPRFVSLRLMAFPKAKISVEKEEICKCDGHTAHKLSQQRITAD
jgi:hypothetical protein